jgi:hypothetical protein
MTNKGARRRNKSCDRWLGDVANVYAIITKKRRITVTIVEYYGMSQQKCNIKYINNHGAWLRKYMRNKITSLKKINPP